MAAGVRLTRAVGPSNPQQSTAITSSLSSLLTAHLLCSRQALTPLRPVTFLNRKFIYSTSYSTYPHTAVRPTEETLQVDQVGRGIIPTTPSFYHHTTSRTVKTACLPWRSRVWPSEVPPVPQNPGKGKPLSGLFRTHPTNMSFISHSTAYWDSYG
jgi:hypothetical protein